MVDYDNWTPDPQIKAVVDKKLAEVRQQFINKNDVPDFIDGAPRTDHIIFNGVEDYEGTQMYRLDWELIVGENEDMLEESNRESVVDLILEMLSTDMYDILENSDKDNANNPVLGGIDGKKKVGKDLKDVILSDIALYKEYVPRKSSVEYTAYLRIGPVWA